jgi:hypothetical protein
MRSISIMIVALTATLAICPALAQEGAPAAGADVPQAGGGPSDGPAMKGPDGAALTNRDLELAAPLRGSKSLWRRANVKTLIANSPGNTAGPPAANARTGLPPVHPGTGVSTPRNAIGMSLTAVRPPGHDGGAVVPNQAGTRLTGVGTAPGSAGGVTHQASAPANTGAAINGTTMGRLVSGSIGGPSRDRTGINGTLMPPKKH